MEKCPSLQSLFDYLQRELQWEQSFRIKAHLESCVTCRSELQKLQRKIRLVKTTLAQLNPTSDRHAESRPDTAQLCFSPKSFLRLPQLAFGFAAALSIVTIVAVLLRDSPVDSYVANAIPAANRFADEAYWPIDVQKNWNDQNIMIQIFDKRSQTMEIMRVSLHNENTKLLQRPGTSAEP